jgi:hypothetical protein
MMLSWCIMMSIGGWEPDGSLEVGTPVVSGLAAKCLTGFAAAATLRLVPFQMAEVPATLKSHGEQS